MRCDPGLLWSNGLCRTVTAVAAGMGHTCAIATGGGVSCWGENADGQLGNGTATSAPGPVEVVGLDAGAVEVSVGGRHSCALLTTGEVSCWGWNWYWQTGQVNTTGRISTPQVVPGLSGVRDLSAGSLHTCAVLASGQVWCWGYNSKGQVGRGPSSSRVFPGVVPDFDGALRVSGGGSHSCALLTDGGAQCWGSNASGQLGTGGTGASWVPQPVASQSSLATLSAGENRTCATTSAGVVECWGLLPVSMLTPRVPLAVPGAPSSAEVLAGTSHICSRTAAGELWCWGSNVNGELGDGTTVDRASPALVSWSSVVAMGNGFTHTCAVATDGRAWCWGSNLRRQLGDGTLLNRSVPTLIVDEP